MARVENWDELAKCAELENRYGVDGAAVAGLVHLMAQLRDQGIITDKDTDGIALTWGGETIRKLVPLIACKKGIGHVLAEGVRRTDAKIGKGADRYANHVKGIHRAPAFSKEVSTGAFGSATNPRGSHSDRSDFQTGAAKADPEAFRSHCLGIGVPEEALNRICDGPDGYNVARLTKWAEDFNTVPLSMGICNRAPVLIRFDLQTLASLYEVATGIETTPAILMMAGERIWNLQKLFNVRHGWTRQDDIPNSLAPDQPMAVERKGYGTFNQLLDEYYEERGWDIESGIPTVEKFVAVGLGNLTEELAPK